MSDISEEQWKAIEEKLAGWFVQQKFQLGEFEICVQKERYKENRYCLVVYIDGTWQGKWMEPDKDEKYGPIVKKVWRRRTFALYPPKKKAQLEKSLGKRRARKLFPNFDKVHERWVPDFSTAKSLVRQFKKAEGLTLIQGGNHDH